MSVCGEHQSGIVVPVSHLSAVERRPAQRREATDGHCLVAALRIARQTWHRRPSTLVHGTLDLRERHFAMAAAFSMRELYLVESCFEVRMFDCDTALLIVVNWLTTDRYRSHSSSFKPTQRLLPAKLSRHKQCAAFYTMSFPAFSSPAFSTPQFGLPYFQVPHFQVSHFQRPPLKVMV